jgi:hypothetical protein
MFDDVHRLRPSQRRMLYEELLDHRTGTPVWLAERTEVLDATDLLTGAVPRRDFHEVQLERAWQQSKGKKFINFVTGNFLTSDCGLTVSQTNGPSVL